MNKPKELSVREGIIIGVAPYKETDAVITIISDNYKYTYRANGAMKPTSKIHLATYIYSTVSLEVGGYKDHEDISSVKLIKNRSYIYENLKLMTCLSIVQEMYQNLVSDEDRLDTRLLEAFLDFNGEITIENMLFATFCVLLQVLQDIGIFNKDLICTTCGKPIKDINYYDMNSGGIICSDCAANMMIYPAEKNKAMILKTAMRIKPEQLYGRQPPLGNLLELFEEVLTYVSDSVGVKLKSFNNFKNWIINL